MRLYSLSYDELVSAGVNPSFARVLSNPDSYHPDLGILIGKTNWVYFIPEGTTDIVPLWDSNANSIVRWRRNDIVEYVWLLHDDPKWVLVARSEQGVMAKLWQEWAEFQESDEECHRFADTIGFRFCSERLDMMEADAGSIESWRLNLTD